MSGVRSEIFATLQLSKNQGLTVHLRLRHQQGVVTTTVLDVRGDIIMVKPVELPGVSLPRTSFYIDEIDSVRCPRILYNAPLYTKLSHIKENIRLFQEKISYHAHGHVKIHNESI
jgi:hypothetical protein